MALIKCPECGNSISDKAEKCPHCGLPASYFLKATSDPEAFSADDYKQLPNILISFDKDYLDLFSPDHYITHREEEHLHKTYGKYFSHLKNRLIFQYVCNNASAFRIDVDSLKQFLRRLHDLNVSITVHNQDYVDRILICEKEYFDSILKDIDPGIRLDDEQRRAVITDDDYCLLVAGAGAGKTTTMAAKVKYLVEKKHVNPEEIIVISYTNKAIGELRERINRGLSIPAKICTFHAFAYDIVKNFSVEPPEINLSSYQIIFDMLEKVIFDDKQLMRNLVLFLGYYFDLTEDVFKFDNLNQFHLYKAAQDYETLKSGLGEYVKKVEQQRTKYVKTLTGEFLRSVQEVQIANFLYLNGLEYEYERVYPFDSPSRSIKAQYNSEEPDDYELCAKKFADEIYLSVLDISFSRKGGCIAIINDNNVDYVQQHCFPKDSLENDNISSEKKTIIKRLISTGAGSSDKHYFQYLDRKLRQELLSLDGATVLDSSGRILCVGAIVKIDGGSDGGGRTAAAVELAKYGMAMKISMDGSIQGFLHSDSQAKPKEIFKAL